jgi:DNA-binding LacI/PurR family transcriptional regulator
VSATLKDVAAHAGVSHKTVSNVIHGNYARVSAETVARVRASIVALNYRPNMAARYLRKEPLKVIALAIPDLVNPYFSSLSTAIVNAATDEGYTVLIDHTKGERDNELKILHGLHPHLIDGMILNPLFLDVEEISTQQGDIPVVLLGQRLFGSPFDHVWSDDIAAARLAINHLLSLGRRRIAIIGVPEDTTDVMPHLRLRGCEEALAAAHIQVDPRLITHVPPRSFHRIHGAQAMKYLLSLDDPPDAVFCFNDLLALGAMKILNECGLRIPDDIAVVGFDNIEEGIFSTPSLTTISVDVEEVGKTAVSLLLKRIRGEQTGMAERVQLPFRLIPRTSTIGDRYSFELSSSEVREN